MYHNMMPVPVLIKVIEDAEVTETSIMQILDDVLETGMVAGIVPSIDAEIPANGPASNWIFPKLMNPL